MFIKEEHDRNVHLSIVSTFPPISTLSNLVHDQNAEFPIDVTELGIVIFSKEEHDSNAELPIVTMPSPIVTVSNLEHP